MKREHRVSWNSGGCIQPDVELIRNASYRYLPVMIARLMVSLNQRGQIHWTTARPTGAVI